MNDNMEKQLEEHGLMMKTEIVTRPDACLCMQCDEARRQAKLDLDGDYHAYLSRCMIVCPECGNKRCPKATFHENACTGSNDSGQAGSKY